MSLSSLKPVQLLETPPQTPVSGGGGGALPPNPQQGLFRPQTHNNLPGFPVSPGSSGSRRNTVGSYRFPLRKHRPTVNHESIRRSVYRFMICFVRAKPNIHHASMFTQSRIESPPHVRFIYSLHKDASEKIERRRIIDYCILS